MRTILLAFVLCLFCLPVLAAGQQIPILLYHHVNYEPSLYSVTPEHLEQDLRRLKANGYETIHLATLEKYLSGEDILPAKPVLLTFDDGYADNYQYAYPLLKKYGMTAVFFIVTGAVDIKGNMETTQIRAMLKDRMEFAAHTETHPLLTDVNDERLKAELTLSKAHLAAILGVDPKAVRTVAYPGGSADLRVRSAADAIGFSLGFSARVGLISRDSYWNFLPRIPIFDYTQDVIGEIDKISLLK